MENKGKLILTGHEIDNSAALLKSINRRNKLLIWEKIFIYKHAHHIMNFEVLSKNSLITKYVYRSPDRVSIAPTNITISWNTIHQSF